MAQDITQNVLAAYVTFGAEGNAQALQVDGWSVPESGFTWSTGDGSRIRIPYRPGRGRLTLEISVIPMRAPGVAPQVLTVLVNGVACGTETVDLECTLGFLLHNVPPGPGGDIELGLHHPGAAAPADYVGGTDTRRLGVAVQEIVLQWLPDERPFTPRRRGSLALRPPALLAEMVRGCTGLAAADLLPYFESIGNNCEFGLVQRMYQVEQLGLLRFGGIAPADLLRGLDTGFDRIDDPAQITLLTESNAGREEYVIRSERYRAQFHSFTSTATPPDEMRRKMVAHLGLLRRKFEETLQGGQSIFVLHHPSCASVAQVRPFLNVLRSWGPTALLFVTADDQPVGSVDQLAADLFQGHIDQLMPQDHPDQINDAAWLSICANTYRMWREGGGGRALDDE